ncbi:MAG: thioredoxin [Candidatus Woesearchaeota archaeon]|jgi:thioredoxin 1|nr:thioredoxin [Candidatus Woesearchaeota archaeon]MDP7181368.1 thioredoxin [Candidatus Woesearchaeota archaeon]MDP7198014.1 thioredoxin [Candidatus Woesearchaeota archaeon]MDP7466848.1 thioredoxin [Candidatus Woesearchaeota archaeon]MDP7647284.1 thioredoxin [Candidatus Woesearchaeota archaeon]
MENLNESNFEEKIGKGKAVVDFWAPWCGPCKMMGPVFEDVSKKVEGVTFAKVNVDEAQELAGKFSVTSIPTIVKLEDGKEVDRRSGFVPEEDLKSWLA